MPIVNVYLQLKPFLANLRLFKKQFFSDQPLGEELEVVRGKGIYVCASKGEYILLRIISMGPLRTNEEICDIAIHCSDTHCNHDVQFLMHRVTLSLAYGLTLCNINFCEGSNIT